MKIGWFLVVLSLVCARSAGTPIKEGNFNLRDTMRRSQFPILYEISTRPWLYELSVRYQRPITCLADIPFEELTKLRDYGVEIVWFMGVWKLGPAGLHHDQTDPKLLESYRHDLPSFTIEDVIGSPYAVVDYTCNPELGTDRDLDELRRKVNSLGMRLGLDFVPNHSAVDCPLVSQHPDYFVRKPQGDPDDPSKYMENGIAYGGGAWTDTAQFNYWNQDLRQVMKDNLLRVAAHADFIRCDMAYLVLNDKVQQMWSHQLNAYGYGRPGTEFWEEAIPALKAKYPDVQLMAEVYESYEGKLQDLGFEYTYDKGLLDHLADGNLDNLRNFLRGNSREWLGHGANFVENHDEPRAVVKLKSVEQSLAGALLSYTVPGVKFINHGQLEGLSYRLAVHLRRSECEPHKTQVEQFYLNLLPILNHDIFLNGEWWNVDVKDDDKAWRLVAFHWSKGEERRLCVINYSNQQGAGHAVLTDAEGSGTIRLTDLLTGTQYDRSAPELRSQGLMVVLEAWQAQIFAY